MARGEPARGAGQRQGEDHRTEVGRPYGGRSLSERRTDERMRLIAAAAEAFASRGYAATSIEHIVDGARVSKTAFYRWFADKEACLLEVFAVGAERLRAALEEATAEPASPAEKVRAGVRAFVGALAADPAMARVVLIEAVGATPAVEEARFRSRAEFADVLVEQMRLATAWQRRSEPRPPWSWPRSAAWPRSSVTLVGAHELERWESSVAPVVAMGPARTDPGQRLVSR